jgi:hypothetical protein
MEGKIGDDPNRGYMAYPDFTVIGTARSQMQLLLFTIRDTEPARSGIVTF